MEPDEKLPPEVNFHCRNCREDWTDYKLGYAEHINCPVCNSTSIEWSEKSLDK